MSLETYSLASYKTGLLVTNSEILPTSKGSGEIHKGVLTLTGIVFNNRKFALKLFRGSEGNCEDKTFSLSQFKI